MEAVGQRYSLQPVRLATAVRLQDRFVRAGVRGVGPVLPSY
jgi:hypothetical protein